MTLTDGVSLTHGSRRQFLKAGSAALAATVVSWNAKSYAAIAGANDRVRVGVVGCGDRMKQSLIPAFLESAKDLNFEFVAISDSMEPPPRRRRGLHREALGREG
jgi:hypothetical protein